MNIRMTGLDWRKAPIGLREALSFTRSRVVELDRLCLLYTSDAADE